MVQRFGLVLIVDGLDFALIFALIGGLLGFGAGYFVGHEHGVEETERRWSDAVIRADRDK